jgi:hypothetical protein
MFLTNALDGYDFEITEGIVREFGFDDRDYYWQETKLMRNEAGDNWSDENMISTEALAMGIPLDVREHPIYKADLSGGEKESRASDRWETDSTELSADFEANIRKEGLSLF